MNDDQMKYLVMRDFSPGIIQRTGITGATGQSPAPQLAASDALTYRCIALPGGGLGPLPKRVRDISVVGPTSTSTYRINGFFLFGPMVNLAYVPVAHEGPFLPSLPGLPSLPFELHVAWEEVTAANQQFFAWRRFRMFDGGTMDSLLTVPLTAAGGGYGRTAPAFFTASKTRPTGGTAADSGPSFIAMAYEPIWPGDHGAVGSVLLYPPPNLPNLNTTQSVTLVPGPIIAHQQRIVTLGNNSWQHGISTDFSYTNNNEIVGFTSPNDVLSPGTFRIDIGPEYPVGYGAWGSLNAGDLVLIKHYGGAYLVQGDMENPIVRRLPGVVSTSGVMTSGASTSVGFVYGVNNDGIYTWQGGDGSLLLSPQMEDSFWVVPNTPERYRGGFLGWGNWILTPNNYLFDVLTKSWWRLDDPAERQLWIWQKDPVNNVVYGVRTGFAAGDEVFCSGYDKATPATNFSWKSQPFNIIPNRRSAIRSLILRAAGTGTVTITLSNEAGQTATRTFTVTSSLVTQLRSNEAFDGADFQIRIVSDGGSGPAPVVYELDLGYQPSTQIAVS